MELSPTTYAMIEMGGVNGVLIAAYLYPHECTIG